MSIFVFRCVSALTGVSNTGKMDSRREKNLTRVICTFVEIALTNIGFYYENKKSLSNFPLQLSNENVSLV